ncbi:unnamed protein product [Bemisia tabaci]|uniref:Uncharacterized protein n=1 Tax=Bemisia tabaci TaxID=7038 RepID=A0A9P0F4G2_BEMTA|nr:unnamed protein product [Bemisia tabaci]
MNVDGVFCDAGAWSRGRGRGRGLVQESSCQVAEAKAGGAGATAELQHEQMKNLNRSLKVEPSSEVSHGHSASTVVHYLQHANDDASSDLEVA